MLKVAVFSMASLTGINRAVYYKLSDYNFDITLIVPSRLKIGKLFKDAEIDNSKKIQVEKLDLKGNNPRSHYFSGSLKLLNRLKPDIVYLENEPVSFIALSLGIWCKLHHAKLYCQALENMPLALGFKVKGKRFKSFFSFFIKKLLIFSTKNLVTHIFSINKDCYDIYAKFGYKSITPIPLGYDPGVFYVNPDARARIRNKYQFDGIIISYFGRIQKEKGVELIIETLENLDSFNWRFLIDNFQLYRNDYSELIYHKIQNASFFNRVIFFDANHYEIADYMNASDIVLVPSYTTSSFKEQYGRVAQEAMACGNLLIVSDSGTLPELIGDAGLIIPENNQKALEEQIRKCLLDLQAFKHFREKARERSFNFLTIDKQAEIMLSKMN